MNAPAVFITEKQERALRRMERLGDLRRARHSWWRAVVRVLVVLFSLRNLSGAIGGFSFFFAMNTPARVPMAIGVAVGVAVSLFFTFLIAPMLRRVEELERLLEEELKRGPSR